MLPRPGIRYCSGKEKHSVSPAKRVTLTRASRGPCRAQAPRLSRRRITPPPLGEGWGGGCWRCKSQKAGRHCSASPHPTPYIPHPSATLCCARGPDAAAKTARFALAQLQGQAQQPGGGEVGNAGHQGTGEQWNERNGQIAGRANQTSGQVTQVAGRQRRQCYPQQQA